ncbi:MAG: diheme cytochrome c-553 [Cyclobacteriaceae bacterium]|nr:diheme cytochrome c-553 [Cyclobacteriaceae bacterium SS2]
MKTIYVLLALVLVTSCAQKPENPATLSEEQVIARGRQLVSLGGCHDCHTPKVFDATGMHLDESRLLSGHPFGSPLPAIDERVFQPGHWTFFNEHLTATVGVWGMTFSKNLTPHETGLKGWTPEVFIATMRTGKHMGIEHGRPIMPPMPWENLKGLPDEDLITIFKFLQSLPPIDNFVPEPMNPTQAIAFK